MKAQDLIQLIESQYKGTEVFSYISRLYDVSKAKHLIRKSPEKYGIVRLLVADWAKLLSSETLISPGKWRINPGVSTVAVKLKKANPKKIAIVVKDGTTVLMIDGWHRLRKAEQDGLKHIYAYYIKDEETLDQIRMK